MILGLIRHVAIAWLEIRRAVRRAGDKRIPYLTIAKATLQWLFPVNRIRDRLIYSVTTVSFHVAIVIVPIFLAGHIVLWQRGTGLSWPAIPNHLADLLTLVAVVTAVALVIERAAARESRSLSGFGDYAVPLLVALPFASGFLAMHPGVNPFPFDVTMLVHVMSGNLLLIIIPVTKLSHCVMLPTTQLVSEVAWHFPPAAGREVGRILGKENEPI
jgi:nitrate reductase gamma subunit